VRVYAKAKVIKTRACGFLWDLCESQTGRRPTEAVGDRPSTCNRPRRPLSSSSRTHTSCCLYNDANVCAEKVYKTPFRLASVVALSYGPSFVRLFSPRSRRISLKITVVFYRTSPLLPRRSEGFRTRRSCGLRWPDNFTTRASKKETSAVSTTTTIRRACSATEIPDDVRFFKLLNSSSKCLTVLESDNVCTEIPSRLHSVGYWQIFKRVASVSGIRL